MPSSVLFVDYSAPGMLPSGFGCCWAWARPQREDRNAAPDHEADETSSLERSIFESHDATRCQFVTTKCVTPRTVPKLHSPMPTAKPHKAIRGRGSRNSPDGSSAMGFSEPSIARQRSLALHLQSAMKIATWCPANPFGSARGAFSLLGQPATFWCLEIPDAFAARLNMPESPTRENRLRMGFPSLGVSCSTRQPQRFCARSSMKYARAFAARDRGAYALASKILEAASRGELSLPRTLGTSAARPSRTRPPLALKILGTDVNFHVTLQKIWRHIRMGLP